MLLSVLHASGVALLAQKYSVWMLASQSFSSLSRPTGATPTSCRRCRSLWPSLEAVVSERPRKAAAAEHSDSEVIGSAQLPDASWWYTAGTVGAGVGDGVGSGVVGAGVGDGVGSEVVGLGL